MKHILYLITRDDERQYVGITIDYRIKNRMAQHRLSNRFKGHCFSYEILQENEDRDIIEEAEILAIEKYNTFEDGLNATQGGKGFGHNSKKFNTLGFKFSAKSRKKMSNSAKERAKSEGFELRSLRSSVVWSDPNKRKLMSELKTGKATHCKLNWETIDNIKNEFISFVFEPIKSRNGLILTRERAFAKLICDQYNVTQQTIYGLINKN